MRKDIMKDANARQNYIDGVHALKQTPADDPRYSRYDWYVIWHAITMMTQTPNPNSSGRNAGHDGPVFLPWHRFYLKRLEAEIADILGIPDFALPYWNWIADGQLDPSQQRDAPIWQSNALGGAGFPITDGPFKFDAADPSGPNSWPVRIELRPNGLVLVERGLARRLGQGQGPRILPSKTWVEQTLRRFTYDSSPWSRGSSASFRNDLEGGSGTGMHNRVHGWIGGDMGFGHSPNDPVFFLHHCNVDRVWAFWQSREGVNNYAPDDNEPDTLFRHRPSDPCLTLSNDPLPGATLSDMFADPSATYDSFVDLDDILNIPIS